MPVLAQKKVLVDPPRPDVAHVLGELHVDFSPSSAIPKYHQLCEILRKKILDGSLPANAQLPTSESVARALRVTRFTVDRAIKELVNKGLVERIQGKGTYVRNTTMPMTSRNILGMIMPARGHVWGTLVQTIVEGLTDEDLFCTISDLSLTEDKPISPEIRQRLGKLIGSGPKSLIVQGVSRFPFDLLEGYTGQLIFAGCFESTKEFDANYVMIDFVEGARQVAEHLYALGHTRYIFLAPKMESRHLVNLSIFHGFRDTLVAKGIPSENIHVAQIENSESYLSMLKKPDRPSAVFCAGDFWAQSVFEELTLCGLSVPDDVSVVGFYNTPWCHRLRPNLTSVCVDEEGIAQAAMDVLKSGRRSSRITLKPTLRIRESCGVKR